MRTLQAVSMSVALALAACSPAAAPAPAPAAGGGAAPNASAQWQQVVEAARKEGRVSVYGSVFSGADGAKVAQEFEKQTGIELDFINGLGAAMTQRIREETKADAPNRADVFEGSGPWVALLHREGFYTSLKGMPLPVLSEPANAWRIQPGHKNAELDYVMSRLRPREGQITINSRLVPAAEHPKTWNELTTSPRFKGKLAMADPNGTGGVVYEWVMQGYVGKSVTLREWWSLYTQQDPLLFPGPRDPMAAVGRNERGIAIGPADDAHLGAIEAGAPIKTMNFPEAPNHAITGEIAILKQAKHPNAAKVFVNWFLSKEGQDYIGRLLKVESLRRDVPSYLAPALKGEVIGGGKRGPLNVETTKQAQLIADLQAAGIFQKLPKGISFEAFEKEYTAFMADWETKNGGPQDKPVPVP